MIDYRYIVSQCKKEFQMPVLYISVLAIFIFTFDAVSKVIMFAKASGNSITPWLFPFITSDYFLQMCLQLTYIFFISVNMHSDKNHFKSGNVVSQVKLTMNDLIIISIKCSMFVISIWMLSVVLCSGYLSLSSQWGETILQLSKPNSFTAIIKEDIVTHYTPIQAVAYSLILLWLVLMFISLIIMVMNRIIKPSFMPLFMCTIGLVDFHVYMYLDGLESIYRIVPTTWSNLFSILNVSGLSIKTCFTRLLILDVTLTLGLLIINSIQSHSYLLRGCKTA